MTAVETLSYTCRACGETKPASAFYADRTSRCKACLIASQMRRREDRRAEMGDDAFRAHQLRIVTRHRVRTGNKTGRQYDRDRNASIAALIELHRDEFEHLMLLARRDELPGYERTEGDAS